MNANRDWSYLLSALRLLPIARDGGCFPAVTEGIAQNLTPQVFTVDGTGSYQGWQYGEWNGWAAVIMTEQEATRLCSDHDVENDGEKLPGGYRNMQGFCLAGKE